jgi:hypothetical protein
LVGWLVSDHLLLKDFGPYEMIFVNVCCYNRCHENAVKGFRSYGVIFMECVFATLDFLSFLTGNFPYKWFQFVAQLRALELKNTQPLRLF